MKRVDPPENRTKVVSKLSSTQKKVTKKVSTEAKPSEPKPPPPMKEISTKKRTTPSVVIKREISSEKKDSYGENAVSSTIAEFEKLMLKMKKLEEELRNEEDPNAKKYLQKNLKKMQQRQENFEADIEKGMEEETLRWKKIVDFKQKESKHEEEKKNLDKSLPDFQKQLDDLTTKLQVLEDTFAGSEQRGFVSTDKKEGDGISLAVSRFCEILQTDPYFKIGGPKDLLDHLPGARESTKKLTGDTKEHIFVFMDGTMCSEDEGTDSSNIQRLSALANEHYGNVIYVEGAGTQSGWPMNFVKGFYGTECDDLIMRAYKAIVAIVKEKEIAEPVVYIFGFSRGSFTCLVNVIRRNGFDLSVLDDPDITIQKLYETEEDKSVFNKVEFLGILDIVSNVMTGGEYHELSLSNVSRAFCGMALNEHRPAFYPTPVKIEKEGHQVTWFVGDHSDVGGAYSGDNPLSFFTLHALADASGLFGIDMSAAEGIDGSIFPYKNVEVHGSTEEAGFVMKFFWRKLVGSTNIICTRKVCVNEDDGLHDSTVRMLKSTDVLTKIQIERMGTAKLIVDK